MNYKTRYLIKLENFLENYRCDNNDNPTHLSYGNFKGKFILNKEQRKQFMNLYYKAITTTMSNVGYIFAAWILP